MTKVSTRAPSIEKVLHSSPSTGQISVAEEGDDLWAYEGHWMVPAERLRSLFDRCGLVIQPGVFSFNSREPRQVIGVETPNVTTLIRNYNTDPFLHYLTPVVLHGAVPVQASDDEGRRHRAYVRNYVVGDTSLLTEEHTTFVRDSWLRFVTKGHKKTLLFQTARGTTAPVYVDDGDRLIGVIAPTNLWDMELNEGRAA